MKRVSVLIPATSANLGPGFDVLGIALDWKNEVRFEADTFSRLPTKSENLSIGMHGEGVTELRSDATNLVVRAANRVFAKARQWPKTLHVTLVNNVPLARGLGSSAAAVLGGIVAANGLIGDPLTEDDVLGLATEMEGHPDNVVPAFAGGLCVSGLFKNGVRYFKLDAPSELRAVICSPTLPLLTPKARKILPSTVPLKSAVFTASRLAFILGAFLNKRYDWLKEAMEDVLHQAPRARLIPGLLEAIRAANGAGAYGAALSGAGSSVMALTKPAKTAAVGRALQRVFESKGIRSHVRTVRLENRGVRVERS